MSTMITWTMGCPLYSIGPNRRCVRFFRGSAVSPKLREEPSKGVFGVGRVRHRAATADRETPGKNRVDAADAAAEAGVNFIQYGHIRMPPGGMEACPRAAQNIGLLKITPRAVFYWDKGDIAGIMAMWRETWNPRES